MKMFVLVGLGLMTLLVLSVGGLVWFAAVRKSPADATATHRGPTPREERVAAEAASRRKFLQNDSDDFNYRSRARFFSLHLRNDGLRCGDVTGATMGKPGVWRVTCSTGNAYLFTFDSQGQYIGSQAYR
jgi:hypothetical protein